MEFVIILISKRTIELAVWDPIWGSKHAARAFQFLSGIHNLLSASTGFDFASDRCLKSSGTSENG